MTGVCGRSVRRPAPLGSSCEEAAVDRKRKRTATSGAPDNGRQATLLQLNEPGKVHGV